MVLGVRFQLLLRIEPLLLNAQGYTKMKAKKEQLNWKANERLS